MFTYLSKLFDFLSFSYTDNLDLFLKSKNVQTAAEVDYWVRQWDKHQRSAYF
jgi:hypothetical protein